MFAQQPTIPEQAQSRLKGEEVANILDSTGTARCERLVNDLVTRSRMLEVTHIHAGLNLHIAQHRDYYRYMSLFEQGHPARSTGYKPGDYVMVWQKPKNKLDARAKPAILQVVDTTSSGVVLLRGADGATVKSQASHLSPCPVQVHPTVDARDRLIPAKEACQICNSPARWSKLMLCDSCNKGWHIDCLNPALTAIPEGSWFCPECSKKKAAPTAQERMQQSRIQHHQTHLATDDTTCALSLLRRMCGINGVSAKLDFFENLIEESNPETGMELHSEKCPGEIEKEQRALMRRFINDCLPKQQREVHATASMAVARSWLWEILHNSRAPETSEADDKRMWVLDIASPELMTVIAMLLDNSGIYPMVIAMKCQQVTKELQRPGLDCLGKQWVPLLTIWVLQGRLKLIGSSPNTWVVIASTCTELVELFTAR